MPLLSSAGSLFWFGVTYSIGSLIADWPIIQIRRLKWDSKRTSLENLILIWKFPVKTWMEHGTLFIAPKSSTIIWIQGMFQILDSPKIWLFDTTDFPKYSILRWPRFSSIASTQTSKNRFTEKSSGSDDRFPKNLDFENLKHRKDGDRSNWVPQYFATMTVIENCDSEFTITMTMDRE